MTETRELSNPPPPTTTAEGACVYGGREGRVGQRGMSKKSMNARQEGGVLVVLIRLAVLVGLGQPPPAVSTTQGGDPLRQRS